MYLPKLKHVLYSACLFHRASAQFDGETISKPVSAKMFDAVCRNNSIYGSMSFWESAKPKLECGKAPISNRLASIQRSFPITRFDIDGRTSRDAARKR